MEPAQEIEPELEEAALRESDGPEPEQEPEREARLAELEARLADIQEELELAKAELAEWRGRALPEEAMKYLRRSMNGGRLEYEISDAPRIGYYISVGGGIGSIDGAGAMELIESGGERMLFGCAPKDLEKYLGHASHCQYLIAYQSVGGVQSLPGIQASELRDLCVTEGGRIKGMYQVMGAPNVTCRDNDHNPVADIPAGLSAEDMHARGVQKCVVTIVVRKITTGSIGNGVQFGTTDSFDIMCRDGNPPKIWTPSAGSDVVPADCEPAPPNWKKVVHATAGVPDAGLGVYFRGSIGPIPRYNWRYHKMCEFMRRHELGPWEVK